jgi:hypothetical protein
MRTGLARGSEANPRRRPMPPVGMIRTDSMPAAFIRPSTHWAARWTSAVWTGSGNVGSAGIRSSPRSRYSTRYFSHEVMLVSIFPNFIYQVIKPFSLPASPRPGVPASPRPGLPLAYEPSITVLYPFAAFPSPRTPIPVPRSYFQISGNRLLTSPIKSPIRDAISRGWDRPGGCAWSRARSTTMRGSIS